MPGLYRDHCGSIARQVRRVIRRCRGDYRHRATNLWKPKASRVLDEVDACRIRACTLHTGRVCVYINVTSRIPLRDTSATIRLFWLRARRRRSKENVRDIHIKNVQELRYPRKGRTTGLRKLLRRNDSGAMQCAVRGCRRGENADSYPAKFRHNTLQRIRARGRNDE